MASDQRCGDCRYYDDDWDGSCEYPVPPSIMRMLPSAIQFGIVGEDDGMNCLCFKRKEG